MSDKQQHAPPDAVQDAISWHSVVSQVFNDNYSNGNKAFLERKTIWSRLIKRYVDEQTDLLDVGCGTGYFSMIAARCCRSVTAFDGSDTVLSIGRENQQKLGMKNIQWHQASLQQLAFLGERKFGVILCSSVLEYVDDYRQVMDQLAQRILPGGVMIISMPNGLSAYRWFEKLQYALTGRPAYMQFVKHVPPLSGFLTAMPPSQWNLLESHYYAPTPVLSPLCRALGLARFSDNLYVVVLQSAVD